MLPLLGKPLLTRVMRRARRARTVDDVVVATTTLPEDDVIVALARTEGWPIERGSESDLLDRYLGAARAHEADVIVRITSDCPLIDPDVIDRTVLEFRATNVDYASNTLEPRTYPNGLDVEVIRREALEQAGQDDGNAAWREHVTPYIYRHPERFRLLRVPADGAGQPEQRWSVDTAEDYQLIGLIFDSFGHDHFTWLEALAVVQNHPAWSLINRHISQKPVPTTSRGRG
jgi:spore coat polysaccharide biosynthesis protein SpsF